MRILHVASSYPLSSGETTAPFMEEMVTALAGRDHELTVIAPHAEGFEEGMRDGVNVMSAHYTPFQTLEIWGHGMSLDENGRLRRSAIAMTPFAMTSMGWQLRRELNRIDYDLVHLHWILPQGFLAFLVPSKIPVVVSMHGADAKYAQGALRPLVRRIVRRADAVVAASSTILETIRDLPGAVDKSHVIPHGADGALFGNATQEEARETLGIQGNERLLVSVGRLVPKKGFNDLIDAIALLDGSEARLVIIGDGPGRSGLEEQAATTTPGRVTFLGEQSRVAVAKWMSASDAVVIPSTPLRGDLDSGPVVLMEGMAAGRPVVSTRVGMAADVIEDGVNGYLVEAGAPQDLSRAIDRTLKRGPEMQVAARATFDRMGDWSRVAEELETVYGHAILRRSSGSSATAI
jgi:glycosyltransferase involved in cell wall biosynthesis